MTIPIQDFDPNDPDAFVIRPVVAAADVFVYTESVHRLIKAARAFRDKERDKTSLESATFLWGFPKTVQELHAAAMALEDE